MTIFIMSDVAVDTAAVVADYGPVPNALIDLDIEHGRFWYNGQIYASVAAIVAAGHGTISGGITRITLPALPAAFSLYAKGVTGTPSAAGYMLSVDDGSDGVPTDQLISIAQGTDSAMSVSMLSTSADQLASNLYQSGAGAAALPIKVAVRVKANDMAASFNGGAAKTDTVATLPLGLANLVVGNRDDGLRPWLGTLHRVTVIGAELNNAALAALAT